VGDVGLERLKLGIVFQQLEDAPLDIRSDVLGLPAAALRFGPTLALLPCVLRRKICNDNRIIVISYAAS
jgi:hypothetical protein